MRRGGGFLPEEPFAQVVVDANNLETFTGKADDAFRADQAGGPRHNNGIHCFFFSHALPINKFIPLDLGGCEMLIGSVQKPFVQ